MQRTLRIPLADNQYIGGKIHQTENNCTFSLFINVNFQNMFGFVPSMQLIDNGGNCTKFFLPFFYQVPMDEKNMANSSF